MGKNLAIIGTLFQGGSALAAFGSISLIIKFLDRLGVIYLQPGVMMTNSQSLLFISVFGMLMSIVGYAFIVHASTRYRFNLERISPLLLVSSVLLVLSVPVGTFLGIVALKSLHRQRLKIGLQKA